VYCVCFEVQTGKHLLGLNLSAFDPGRVETPFIPQKLQRMGVVHVDVTV
jgi:hypothetical protein